MSEIFISDNGRQFASAEFRHFANEWQFHHVTSSSRYPQANGKVENAVRTIKRLFKKCTLSGQSKFHALLDWRNTVLTAVQCNASWQEDAGPHFRLAKLSYNLIFVWMRTQPHYWRRNKSNSGVIIELVAKLARSRQAMLSGCSVQDLRYGHMVSVCAKWLHDRSTFTSVVSLTGAISAT